MRPALDVPNRSAVSCLTPLGKDCKAVTCAVARSRWARPSPANAAKHDSGSALARARIAPAAPTSPAMAERGRLTGGPGDDDPLHAKLHQAGSVVGGVDVSVVGEEGDQGDADAGEQAEATA